MTALRVLITGINGLIGTILHKAFKDRYDIYGADLEGDFSERVVKADISRYPEIAGAVQRFSPVDVILHLAGNPNVDATWEEVLHANIIGTRNVFEAAREFNVRKVIFASSNHATGAYEGLGENQYLPPEGELEVISPLDPIRPDSDYGVSKVFGEAVASYYRSRWGVEAICLRIGAVLKQDDPTRDERNRRIWLSHRDLVQLVEKSMTANVPFGVYYGVSNNKEIFWDISNARNDLGYEPVDDAFER